MLPQGYDVLEFQCSDEVKYEIMHFTLALKQFSI
jgi:hypothetical protein